MAEIFPLDGFMYVCMPVGIEKHKVSSKKKL